MQRDFRLSARVQFLSLAMLASSTAVLGSRGGIQPAPVLPPGTSWPDAVANYPAVSWDDFDGDGLRDALILQAGENARLLQGSTGGKLEDVSEASGLSLFFGAHAGAWADFDGDGLQDLFLVSWTEGGRLLRQVKSGVFEEVSKGFGLSLNESLYAASWIDYDGDGRPDLHTVGPLADRLYRNYVGGFVEIDLDPARLGLTISGSGLGTPAAGPFIGAQPTVLPPPVAGSLVDQSNPSSNIKASTVATVGMLYPIGADFFIDAGAGRVGLGNMNPQHALDVAGTIRSRSGGVVFPDGTLQSTATLVGPQGPQGPQGIQGDVGPIGPIGPTGPQGPDGPAGPQGTQGIQGDVGPIGPIGPQGPQGIDGPVGPQGIQGIQGDVGPIGPIGPQGPQGIDGPIGPQGIQGTQGDVGPIGPIGPTGPQGLQGDPGPIGPQGNTGPQGIQGDPGPAGPQGPQGPQGTQGDVGPVGPTGPEGPAGIAPPGNLHESIRHDGTDWVAASLPVNTGTRMGMGVFQPVARLDVSTASSTDLAAVRVSGVNGPTTGYLGGQGTYNYDSVPTADWAGFEIGVAGISAGGSALDNYGVLGHSNGVGVRGESSLSPGVDWGELGVVTTGVRGNGSSLGVLGTTQSVSGSGVRGEGRANGVTGQSTGNGGNGAVGHSTALVGSGAGVLGQTESPDGVGVYGLANAITGTGAGVHGEATSPDGVGVFGFCAEADCGGPSQPACTGTGAGVLGRGNMNMSGTGTDAIRAEGSLAVTGAKAFAMPDPTNPAGEIRYLCLEGNESGTYFRGTAQIVNGRSVIAVPESFALVTDPEGITVQITLVGGWTKSWVESSDLNSIVVRGEDDLTFHYMVNGIRRGYRDYQVRRPNVSYRPEVRGVPFGMQYPESQRQMMVESGLLNADFTPNEVVMQGLGWRLREAREEELRPTLRQ